MVRGREARGLPTKDMAAHHLIQDISLCIVAAWLLSLVARAIRLPLMIAYLAAGVLLGPVGFGWIAERTEIETIAELGLIFLLFMIGLEIDLKRIVSAGRAIVLTSVIQFVGGALLGVVLFAWLGFAFGGGHLDALYLGVAAALSSTVIIVKILYDKRELNTLGGRITLGVLVIQDLFAILFLALQPNLKNPELGTALISLGKVGILVVTALAVSRYVLPPLFRSVARLPEVVLVGALAWCFVVGGFAQWLGLSREMGALISGVALSTFPYALDVTAKVTTLRDFFITLFFVALGMSIPAPTSALLGWASVLCVFLIVSRFLTVFLPLHWMKLGHRASLLPTINLCQVSEFSLVILALGFDAGHISESTKGIVAYAFAILATSSSFAILQNDGLLRVISPILARIGLADLPPGAAAGSDHGHAAKPIYLLGFSWTASSLFEEIGRRAPELLEDIGVVDFNPHVVEELRRRGAAVYYGDISQRDTLLHAGVGSAELILCTLPDSVLKGSNNVRLLQHVRDLSPNAKIVMHAELFTEIPKLYAAGADFVSVPRLVEATTLVDVILSARAGKLEMRREELDRELKDRNEVIP